MFATAMDDNLNQLRSLLVGLVPRSEPLAILDLGCGDGRNFLRYAPPASRLYAVEACHELAQLASQRAIKTVVADLEAPLPLPDAAFDAVISNQVFEHLADTDLFIAECFRVVRPGGVVIVSTENLSSWHNIAALCLGWQAFSLTNVSRKMGGVGNPCANLRGDEPLPAGMYHRRVFSYRGLVELMRAHGFVDVQLRGAGYYPLPSTLAHADPRHAAFLTVACICPSLA